MITKLELSEANNKIRALKDLVDKQSNDESIWFEAKTISEAYLQKELRKLHYLIERNNNW